MVAGSIIGIIPGAIHGAATAPSPEEVEQAESALKAALSDLQLHEIVSDGVVQAARDLNRRQVVLPPDQGPVAPGEAVSYRPLAENGTDTILEIRGPVVRLRAELGTDPPMALFMTLRARLIRTADDETLYEGRVEYRSEKHRFSEWAADGASLFREAVARGCWSLAGRVVEEIFMLYPRPASGLRPEYPEARPNFEVDTLQPVFRWEPFPGEYDTGLEMDRIGHVTYDLRIFRAEEEEFVRLASTLTPDYPAQVVYQRDGLAGPSHQIETPLPPSTRYYWTIRARFELDGHPRVTQWGLAWSPVTRREWGGIGIHGDRTMGRVPRNPNPYFYRFRTPSKPR